MIVKITILVGNPKPNSRTLHVAETLVRKLLCGQVYELNVIDLADYSDRIFQWPCNVLNALLDLAADSSLLVVASPTYKATYTGLLKAFLDRYPANALTGVVALPVMTGADLTHSMAPTVNLTPLLIELGASVPCRGFYFVTGKMDKLDESIDERIAEYRNVLRTPRLIA